MSDYLVRTGQSVVHSRWKRMPPRDTPTAISQLPSSPHTQTQAIKGNELVSTVDIKELDMGFAAHHDDSDRSPGFLFGEDVPDAVDSTPNEATGTRRLSNTAYALVPAQVNFNQKFSPTESSRKPPIRHSCPVDVIDVSYGDLRHATQLGVTLPATAHHGNYQAPCFGQSVAVSSSVHESTSLIFIPDGGSVHIFDPKNGEAACALSTEPLGLSPVVHVSAYDTALRLLLLGDLNGRSTRVVAVDPITRSRRWDVEGGGLNSCCGIAVLSAKGVVVVSSLTDLHVCLAP